MISARHYCTAILGAVLIHFAGLFLLGYSVTGGAMDKGEQGIEVDLGMLGDLGSAVDTQQSAAIETPPIDKLEKAEPAITALPIVQKLEKKVTKEIAAPVELKQTADIFVKKDPVKKAPVKKDPVKKVEQIEKEVPESAEPADIKKSPNNMVKKEETIKPLQAPVSKSAEAIKTGEKNQDSALKMSTGSADALTSGGLKGYNKSYHALIAATLAKYKRYPNYARENAQEGTVLLSFTVLRSGLVKDINIKKSAGYRQLDRAVRKMLQQASPFPSFPAQHSGQEIIISIPIVFKLNQ